MIISASKRTDIPAFHGDWFMEQIKQGYTIIENPYNHLKTKVSLLPEDVVRRFYCNDKKLIEDYVKDWDEKEKYKYKYIYYRILSDRAGVNRWPI